MSDAALKNLIAATCIVIIAAIGWFAFTSYQQSQTNQLDKQIAEQQRLVKELQRRTGAR